MRVCVAAQVIRLINACGLLCLTAALPQGSKSTPPPWGWQQMLRQPLVKRGPMYTDDLCSWVSYTEEIKELEDFIASRP